MRTVHKLAVPLDRRFKIPPGAEIVLFGPDSRGGLCVWYDYYTEKLGLQGHIEFKIFGTGFDINEDFIHMASTIDKEGYVWHLYRAP